MTSQELTARDVATVMRCHERTAQRWCDAWLSLARSHPVPRVTVFRSGRRGRPSYRVDAASLRAWLRGAALASN